MNRRIVALALALGLLPLADAVAQGKVKTPAQGETQIVYEVRGPNGPTYSDKPMPGARTIELPPLNVVDFKSLPVPAPAPAATPSPAAKPKADGGKVVASSYRNLAIVSPEQNGSVIAPSASFEVRLALEPPLSLGEGHAFSISLNGKPVGQRFTATEFMIPPEFWGDKLPPPNQRFELSVSVVDRDGATLKEALPVAFTLRYASVRPLQSNMPRRIPDLDAALPVPGKAKTPQLPAR